MNRYAVSLVFTKQVPSGIDVVNRLAVLRAQSDSEAKGIVLESEWKKYNGYQLNNSVVLEIVEEKEIV